MDKHINLVGYLHLAYGALLLLVALFVGLSLAGGGLLADDPGVAGILSGVGVGVFILLAVLAAPSLIGGWGVLQRKSWGRSVIFVLSILNLFSFPIGTLLGGYALWVLAQDETKAAFSPGDASLTS